MQTCGAKQILIETLQKTALHLIIQHFSHTIFSWSIANALKEKSTYDTFQTVADGMYHSSSMNIRKRLKPDPRTQISVINVYFSTVTLLWHECT